MTRDAAIEPREAERRRLRLRRRLALWALPAVLAAGLVGAKLVHQHLAAERAVAEYLDGDFEAALNTASQLQWLNWVERWKPDYDVGTSLLALDALEEAQASLERALALAEPPEQCPIRANLAITIERQGDRALAADDLGGAIEKWVEALAVVQERDESCAESSSHRSLEDTEARLLEKLAEHTEPQGGEGGEGGEDPEPDPNRPDPQPLEEIEEGLDEHRQERDDRLREQEQWGEGGGVDEPW